MAHPSHRRLTLGAVAALGALTLFVACQADAPTELAPTQSAANARAGYDTPGMHRQYGPPLKVGNVTLLERPVRTIALISAAHSALRARDRQYQVRLADQRKDEFLATLAHELRNPLAPIRTSISIIRRLQPSDEVRKLTDIVDRQVVHLTRLVDDLLDVARITTGKVALNATHTTLSAVMVPPMLSTIVLAMASPRPKPASPSARALSLRKKRSKMRGRSVSEMPSPLSLTVMIAVSRRPVVVTTTWP